jgi:hypothetical protein
MALKKRFPELYNDDISQWVIVSKDCYDSTCQAKWQVLLQQCHGQCD